MSPTTNVNILLTWRDLFPFVIWNLWMNRNRNNQNSTNRVMSSMTAINHAVEYKLMTDRESNHTKKIPIHIRWHKPPAGWYKLNIDVSFNVNKVCCGMGGVVRNCKDDWVVGYQDYSRAISPLHAEFLALRQGLQVVMQMNLTPVEVEIDSTGVIKYLKNGCPTYDALIYNCSLLLSGMGKPGIMHNFREGNKVAHLLAKKEINQSNMNHLVYLAVPPPLFETKVWADKDGDSSLKLVVDNACRMLAELGNRNALEGITVACNSMEQL
ncbi:uncharacterized protein LOC142163038 [Nicotiana tabacum]|uniref:Uncharacterized protein LOC142163038 n=1 Tax=Nicotiana tabacum TaxID=4097 RepID=A0AC58RUP3_TOBAC